MPAHPHVSYGRPELQADGGTQLSRLTHGRSGADWCHLSFSASDLEAIVTITTTGSAEESRGFDEWLGEVALALRDYYDGRGYFSGAPGQSQDTLREITEHELARWLAAKPSAFGLASVTRAMFTEPSCARTHCVQPDQRFPGVDQPDGAIASLLTLTKERQSPLDCSKDRASSDQACLKLRGLVATDGGRRRLADALITAGARATEDAMRALAGSQAEASVPEETRLLLSKLESGWAAWNVAERSIAETFSCPALAPFVVDATDRWSSRPDLRPGFLYAVARYAKSCAPSPGRGLPSSLEPIRGMGAPFSVSLLNDMLVMAPRAMELVPEIWTLFRDDSHFTRVDAVLRALPQNPDAARPAFACSGVYRDLWESCVEVHPALVALVTELRRTHDFAGLAKLRAWFSRYAPMIDEYRLDDLAALLGVSARPYAVASKSKPKARPTASPPKEEATSVTENGPLAPLPPPIVDDRF